MNRLLLILLTAALISACGGESSTNRTATNDGTGGSTALFAMVDDYLYTISGSSLQLFDISAPESPNPWAKVYLDWDIETLFPYEDHLLVGSQTGVHILDNSDPGDPRYITEFSHNRSCDPVVAENDVAYVTLHSAANCNAGDLNQLDVLDIEDLENPKLIKTYPMQTPKGLAVDGQYLFICDDIAGLKVFDTTTPDALTVLDTVPGVDCFDVIAKDQRLYVSVTDRLLQYDYSSLPLTKISELTVAPN